MNDDIDRPFQARLQETLSIVKWLDCKEHDLEAALKAIPVEIRDHQSMKDLLERLGSMAIDESTGAMLGTIRQLSDDPRAQAEMRELASEMAFHPDFVRAINDMLF